MCALADMQMCQSLHHKNW